MKGLFKKLIDVYAKLSKRERLILYVTTAVLTAVAMDRLVIGPVYRKMLALDKQTQEETEAIKRSLHVLVRKKQILSEGKQLTAFISVARDPEEEMTGLLKELEKMAVSSAVSLLYVKPGLVVSEGNARKYTASLECEAEMGSVAVFFHVIESSNKLLRIEKYDIQPKAKESSVARCTVTVSKTVFV